MDNIVYNKSKTNDQEYSVLYNNVVVAKYIIKDDLSFSIMTNLGATLYSGTSDTLENIFISTEEIIKEYIDKPKVIWLNTWFSSIKSTLTDLKKSIPNLITIGTHKDRNCTYCNSVDAFYTEPFGCSPKEYLEFALEFCKKCHVDLIMPKSYALTIQQNKQLFNDTGIGIIAEDADNMILCRSKRAVYEKLSLLGYNKIPVYEMATSIGDFITASNKLGNDNICFKYDSDEGASSFRRIKQSSLTYESLTSPLENTLSYDDAIQILTDAEKKNKFKPLMVMPILDGPEVSVDCYKSNNRGFIAIPRFKVGNRIKEIQFDEDIIEDAERIGKLLGLQSAYNVQYRWDKKGNMRLIEVNTRISGGIHMSSMCGISIPNQLVADSIGYNISQGEPKECTVTQYEQAIKLI